MQTREVSQILAQIRAISTQTSQGIPRPDFGKVPEPTQFTDVLAQSVNKVNTLQANAAAASAALERGDPGADVASTMIAMQKASLSFQAVTQVRNRLVSAYQDIMNMTV